MAAWVWERCFVVLFRVSPARLKNAQKGTQESPANVSMSCFVSVKRLIEKVV